MDKKVNVLIRNDKTIFVETENYKGEACVSAVKDLFKTFLELDNFELTSPASNQKGIYARFA